MDNLQFDLIEIIKTKEDKVLFLAQLEAVSHALFSHTADIPGILDQKLSYRSKEKLIEMAKKNNISVSDMQSFQIFIEHIKKTIGQISEITITLAFDPSQEVVTAISLWFSLHVKKPMILDILIDRTLFGGAIVGYNGIYKDYSLKKKLHDRYAKGEIKLMDSS